MAWNLPDGCTDRDVDVAAGGYDAPECECRYDPQTDEMDSDACWIHGDVAVMHVEKVADQEEDIDCPF